MSIKRKKKIAVLFFMMIIMAMTSITAFATINSYSNSLPSVQGHVTLVGGLNAKKVGSPPAVLLMKLKHWETTIGMPYAGWITCPEEIG